MCVCVCVCVCMCAPHSSRMCLVTCINVKFNIASCCSLLCVMFSCLDPRCTGPHSSNEDCSSRSETVEHFLF